jgi:hypothetical protein
MDSFWHGANNYISYRVKRRTAQEMWSGGSACSVLAVCHMVSQDGTTQLEWRL